MAKARGPNKIVEAFKESYNTVGLAALAAVSAATLNPLPILAGLVLETAYLLTVPDSKWFEKRLAARYDAEIRERREKLKNQVMPALRRVMQEKFLRLEHTRENMTFNSEEGRKWYREVLRKLDYLLEKYLMFANKEQQVRDYLRGVMQEVLREDAKDSKRKRSDDDIEFEITRKSKKQRGPLPPPEQVWWDEPPLDPAEEWVASIVEKVQAFYMAEIEKITHTLAGNTDDLHNNAILEKRMDVLQRRHEYVGKSGRILVNLNHQLELMGDTFGLINDELRSRSPEQVLADIDSVVFTTNTLTETIEAVSPLEELEIPA